jgi:hypothetical protein
MSRTSLSLAGFQVIIIGRFWVIAEGVPSGYKLVGYGHFKNDVPLDIQKEIVADFNKPEPKMVNPNSQESLQDRGWRVIEDGVPIQEQYQFIVHKKVNKLRLTGLIGASFFVPALIIQSLISVLAWVGRGFRHA